ncbi:MAG: ester cyclase [Limisphaerales bacterium]
MPEKYATFAHEWFQEVWNQGKAEAIDRLMADDAIAHGLTDKNGKELRGPASFKEFHRSFRDAFPDLKIEVADTVAAGDKLVARYVVRGTHKGEGLGFKATGKPAEFTGISIIRVENAKIVEAWNRPTDEVRRLGS